MMWRKSEDGYGVVAILFHLIGAVRASNCAEADG